MTGLKTDAAGDALAEHVANMRRRPRGPLRNRGDRIPFAELERLVRERAYVRPLAAVPPLHRMALERSRLAGAGPEQHEPEEST